MTLPVKHLLVALPLALIAACGGSDSEQLASGLTKAEFVTKAEAICSKANADVKAAAFPTSPAGLPVYVQTLVDIADKATKAVSALVPPAADKADLQTKVLTPLAGQVAEGRVYLEKIKTAVAANDQAKLGELIASPPAGSKADLDWMRSYGFVSCVESADTKS